MDWMGIAWGLNNTKLWRPQTEDGRWRYVVYDTDGSWGYFGQGAWENYLNYARNSWNEHAEIFNSLLYNEQFQCEFINRYADLINTIFQSGNVSSVSKYFSRKIFFSFASSLKRDLNFSWSSKSPTLIPALPALSS